jgi:hypothetical protein
MTGETEFIGEGLIRTEKDLDKIVLPDPRDEGFYDPAKRFMEKYHGSDLAIYAGFDPASRSSRHWIPGHARNDRTVISKKLGK